MHASLVCVYLFPSCCFVPEPTYQDHPRSCLVQKEAVDVLDSRKIEHLNQYPDPYQLPQYVDQIRKLPVIQQQEVNEQADKEIGMPILLASHTNRKAEVILRSPECQRPVPFLKLLAECEERLSLREQLNEAIQDTSRQQDLQSGTGPGTKLVYRE